MSLERRGDTSQKSRRATNLRCDLQQLVQINASKTVDLWALRRIVRASLRAVCGPLFC
jgi:hypothetical protein